MSKIKIMPDSLANKIAAGEVVERPASVVKELLENSLDAGAHKINIEVEAGGKRLIRIVDDGEGLTRDDAIIAFERHATSKLRTADDLENITTLGFRAGAASARRFRAFCFKTERYEARSRVQRRKAVRFGTSPAAAPSRREGLFFNIPAEQVLRATHRKRSHNKLVT